MTDNELLLAISDIMEKKLDARIQPLEDEIKSIKDEQRRINIIIENEIRSDIRRLASAPSAAALRHLHFRASVHLPPPGGFIYLALI